MCGVSFDETFLIPTSSKRNGYKGFIYRICRQANSNPSEYVITFEYFTKDKTLRVYSAMRLDLAALVVQYLIANVLCTRVKDAPGFSHVPFFQVCKDLSYRFDQTRKKDSFATLSPEQKREVIKRLAEKDLEAIRKHRSSEAVEHSLKSSGRKCRADIRKTMNKVVGAFKAHNLINGYDRDYIKGSLQTMLSWELERGFNNSDPRPNSRRFTMCQACCSIYESLADFFGFDVSTHRVDNDWNASAHLVFFAEQVEAFTRILQTHLITNEEKGNFDCINVDMLFMPLFPILSTLVCPDAVFDAQNSFKLWSKYVDWLNYPTNGDRIIAPEELIEPMRQFKDAINTIAKELFRLETQKRLQSRKQAPHKLDSPTSGSKKRMTLPREKRRNGVSVVMGREAHPAINVESGVSITVFTKDKKETRYRFRGEKQWDILNRFLLSLKNGENNDPGNFHIPFTSGDMNNCKGVFRTFVKTLIERQPLIHPDRHKTKEPFARFRVELLGNPAKDARVGPITDAKLEPKKRRKKA